MSKKPIAVISTKLRSNSEQIKKIASIQAISLLMFSMCSVVFLPTKAKAESTAPAPIENTTPTDNTNNTPSDNNSPKPPTESNTPTEDNKTDNSKQKNLIATPEQSQSVKAQVAGISGGANISGVQGTQIAVSPLTPIQVTSDTNPVTVQVNVPSGNLSMTTTTGLSFTGTDKGPFIIFSGSVSDVNAALATLRYQPVATGTFTISAQVVPSDSFFNPSNGNYYRAVGDYVTFSDAITNSTALTYEGVNGHLVTITSQAENDFVHNQVNATSWIAASDASVENDWRWVAGPQSGTLFWTGGRNGSGGHSVNGLYSNWADGEPNNSGNVEDCAQMYSWNSKWNDVDCEGSLPYIVEFENPAQPPSVSLQASVTTPPPVTVGNCDELEDVALNPENYWFSDITLTANIDCTDYSPMTALFTDSAQPYHGTFDGAGYTISNANVVGGSNVGLFGYVELGTIKNLNLSSSTIIGNQCVGTIVGRAKNSNLENNNSSANILANTNYNWGYGGIIGCFESNTDGQSYAVRGNTYTGTITGNEGINYYEWVGGINGYLYTQGSSTVNMDNNIFGGTIRGAYYYVGGVGGYAYIEGASNVTLSGNFNQGAIETSQDEIGGFMGYAEIYNTSRLALDNNNFDSTAKILDNVEYVGGVAGYLDVYDNAYIQANNNQINGLVGGATEGGRYADDSVGGIVGFLYCYTNYSVDGNCVFNNNNNNSDIYTNYDYSGGVIGYAENYGNTIIGNNTNSGHISSDFNNYDGYNGGMIGYFYSYNYDSGVRTSTTIQNNTNNGMVEGYYYAGGMIGYAYMYNDYNDSSMTLNISNNSSNGQVYADNEAGGLVGYVAQYNYYQDTGSETNVNITDNTVNATVEGNEYIGGVLGYIDANDDSEAGKVNNNISSNTVNGDINTNGGGDLGGVIGYLSQYYSNLNLSNNQINSDISTNVPGDSYEIGGLIGYGSGYGSLTNQINSNTITGSIAGGWDTGGIFGYTTSSWGAQNVLQNNTTTSTATINGTGEVGGFIGAASLGQSPLALIQNLNEAAVNGSDNYVGGFIGKLSTQANYDVATTTLTQNINRGDVHAQGSYVGGLIGHSYLNTGNPTTGTIDIQDNYNSGRITADDTTAGGLIGFNQVENYAPEGYYSTTNIQRNYNSGAVTAGNANAGGLIGWAYPANNSQAITNIDNSFATGNVTGSVSAPAQTGGVIGFMDGNDMEVPVGNGVYYDQTATGQSACNTNNAGPEIFLSDCTAVNTDGSQPNYFKNNTTNAPLNTWNFVNVWGTQANINDGLPCLQWENPLCNPQGDNDGDGISNAVENAGPNGGDANGDGIADYRQPTVTSLVDTVSGKYNLIQTSCSQNSSVYNEAESTTNRDKEYDYPVGLTGFTTTCPSEGATAHITYYVYGTFDPSAITVRKYNPTTGAYATVTGATLTNITIGGQAVLKVEYDVTDGGEFDLDGQANGVIVDPVGLGTTATIAPNTGYGRI